MRRPVTLFDAARRIHVSDRSSLYGPSTEMRCARHTHTNGNSDYGQCHQQLTGPFNFAEHAAKYAEEAGLASPHPSTAAAAVEITGLHFNVFFLRIVVQNSRFITAPQLHFSH